MALKTPQTDQPVLGGQLYRRSLDGWTVTWESQSDYRHWCFQEYEQHWPTILVLMFNPGSLSHEGKDLKRDTTLRVLREVFGAARCNPFIINLFDFCATSPDSLFQHWSRRDADTLLLEQLDYTGFRGYIRAYGDMGRGSPFEPDINQRIALAMLHLSSLREIDLPTNASGSPKHPLTWQRQRIKAEIAALLAPYS